MSAASFHVKLRAGVRQRLQALTGLPPVAWQGREFAPVKGQAFIAESFTPVSSLVRGTGLGGYIAHTVSATFRLNYPTNAGTVAMETMAGALLQHFRPGTSITYDGISGLVLQAERAGFTQEPDWLSSTVIVTLIGHTTN